MNVNRPSNSNTLGVARTMLMAALVLANGQLGKFIDARSVCRASGIDHASAQLARSTSRLFAECGKARIFSDGSRVSILIPDVAELFRLRGIDHNFRSFPSVEFRYCNHQVDSRSGEPSGGLVRDFTSRTGDSFVGERAPGPDECPDGVCRAAPNARHRIVGKRLERLPHDKRWRPFAHRRVRS